MAESSPASRIESIQLQLDQLCVCSFRPDIVSAGRVNATANEILLLYAALQELKIIFERLPVRDAEAITVVADDWTSLVSELNPIARGLHEACTSNNESFLNLAATTSGEISRKKLQLIRCKLQQRVAQLSLMYVHTSKRKQALQSTNCGRAVGSSEPAPLTRLWPTLPAGLATSEFRRRRCPQILNFSKQVQSQTGFVPRTD